MVPITTWGKTSDPETERRRGIGLAVFSIAALFFQVIYYVWPQLSEPMRRSLSEASGRAVLTVVIVGVAILLFQFRQTSLYYYAIVETAFGIVSAWQAAGAVEANAFQWPLIAATAYLIVRGLTNLNEARTRQNRVQPTSGTSEEADFQPNAVRNS